MHDSWVARLCLHIATLGPVGYLPAPGTCGTIVSIPIVHGVRRLVGYDYELICFVCLLVCSLVCTHIASLYFPYQDPPQIVIDETIGYAVSIYHIPDAWLWSLCATFLLFRIFDTAKLLGVSYVECIPGASGVVADDIVAGVYARIIVAIGVWYYL